jgi:alkyldihydroxyacetonephosphate synthase
MDAAKPTPVLAPVGVAAIAPAAAAPARAPAVAGAGIITNEDDDMTLPVKAAGWGFPDTELRLNKTGQVELTGNRYLFSGKEFPNLRSWMEKNASLNIDWASPAQPPAPTPAPVKNEAFIEAIKGSYDRLSFHGQERVLHAHGHTAQEVFTVKFDQFKRIPDAIVWPACHEHVEAIVAAAVAHNVVLIPYGGGTSVSHALLPPEHETRMIVSVDMHRMNRIKWINKANMTACIEAGAVGKDIDRKLAEHGLVTGHEPDSLEFSTLGGWVATRASGMRKNKYGNIEALIVHLTVVTPRGTLSRSVHVPRVSAGPDIHEMILGSEGTMGIVTEVVVRLRPKPEVVKYGSILFPSFADGVACLHEVGLKRAAPVSIRLVDNKQFQFGQALKPGNDHWSEDFKDKVKKWYVTKRLHYDPERMVAATLLFEGDATEVAAQEKVLYAIAAKHGGYKAGEENGIRGYFLTYIIAYLRDFGFNYKFIAESFETSVPYSNILPLCEAVKKTIEATAVAAGVKFKPFVSCRVTQLYDTGAAVYFYFGFVWQGLSDPVAAYSAIEHAAREEIFRHGGSISHHHGIGKLRAEYLPGTVGDQGMRMIKAVKDAVDPTNIFAVGNLGLDKVAPAAKL